MARSLIGVGRNNQAVTLGNFATFGGTPGSSGYATESLIARSVRVAGVFSNLTAHVNNQGTSRTLRFRKNSADGNQILSFTDSTNETISSSNTDSLGTADTYDLQLTGTAPAFTLYAATAQFVANSGHATIFSSSASVLNSTLDFFVALAAGTSNTLEDIRNLMRSSGTLQGGAVAVSVASTSQATAVTRINGADGNISITIPANTTGLFEDTTHTDAFASGDLLNWKVTGHSAGTVVQFITTATLGTLRTDLFMLPLGNISFNASAQFLCPLGSAAATTTEADVLITHGFGVKTSNFRCLVFANTLASTMTAIVRKNGGNGNQTLAITATTTGTFEDSTNTDTFAPTDTFSYQFTGGTSGLITVRNFGITELPPHEAAAMFAGAGVLRAQAALNMAAAATLPGAGALSVDAAKSKEAAATLAGAGSISASATSGQAIAATLDGQGSLTASVLAGLAISAHLDGIGALLASAGLNEAASAVLEGAGSLEVDATKAPRTIEAIFSGQGDFSALGFLAQNIAATFDGTGDLSGAVSATLAAAAILDGSGAMSAAIQRGLDNEVDLDGAGNLSAAAIQVSTAFATLPGSGAFFALAALVQPAAAELPGNGALAVDAVVFRAGAAIFQGTGSLQLSAEIAAAGSVIFTGLGALSVQLTVAAVVDVLMPGSGIMSIDADLIAGPYIYAELAGASDLAADTNVSAAALAVLAGSGSLSVGAIIINTDFRPYSAETDVTFATASTGITYCSADTIVRPIRPGRQQ